MKNVCFTGHRNVNESAELTGRLEQTISSVIEQGAEDFYDGGALGWDIICAEAVIRMRTEFKNIRLHMILPCPPEIQSAGWRNKSIVRYDNILSAANSITIVSDHYTPSCMKLRNMKLIELADCCICYFNDYRSGTGQTVRMARNKNIPIYNLAE